MRLLGLEGTTGFGAIGGGRLLVGTGGGEEEEERVEEAEEVGREGIEGGGEVDVEFPPAAAFLASNWAFHGGTPFGAIGARPGITGTGVELFDGV